MRVGAGASGAGAAFARCLTGSVRIGSARTGVAGAVGAWARPSAASKKARCAAARACSVERRPWVCGGDPERGGTAAKGFKPTENLTSC